MGPAEEPIEEKTEDLSTPVDPSPRKVKRGRPPKAAKAPAPGSKGDHYRKLFGGK